MVRVLHPDLGAGVVGASSEPGRAGDYRLTEGGVRLRAAPGTSGPIRVEDLGAGTVVTAVDDQVVSGDGHQWRHVRTAGGTVGFVAAEFLVQIGPGPEPRQDDARSEPTEARFRLTEGGVRLRAAPGTSHPIVLEDLGAGTVVTAVDDLEASSDGHVWRHVDVGGTVGWVAAEFLQQIGTEPSSSTIGDRVTPTGAWQFFTAEQIAEVTSCPIDAIRDAWPRLVGQFELCGINDRAVQVAAMGTVAIETASTFAPVREAFWLDETWRRDNLTRYYPYYGRGYVQITWESNYRAYSRKINELWGAGDAIDLIARPDDAMDPDVAAAVLALYFRDHGGDGLRLSPEAARRGDWREVRRLVQGGDAKVEELIAMAGSAIAVADAGLVTA
jgi:hypothetical protein